MQGVSSGEPKRVTVSGADTRISVLDYGNESAPAMVLVHGIRDLALSLHPIAERFRSTHHVVAPDLRGHGESGKPGAYTLPHYVADLRGTLRGLDLRGVVLIGHSLGAQVVAQYAALFGEDVNACVLIEGLGPPEREGEGSPEGRREIGRTSIETLMELGGDARSMPDLDAAVDRVLKNHLRLDPARARFLAAEGTSPHPAGGLRWKWDPRVQSTFLSSVREQTEERWGWIACPVLVVMGSTSNQWWSRVRGGSSSSRFSGSLGDEELRRRVGLFPDARHVEISDAGHMVHFDQPDRLNEEIARFLDDRVAAPTPLDEEP